MNAIFEWLARLVGSWKCWIVIAPWDVGVRIRLGKVAAAMSPGLHFRIPFIDDITLINTRVRMTGTPMVTLSGDKPNVTRSISATVAYEIFDPIKAMLAYTYPDSIIVGAVQGCIARSGTEVQCLAELKELMEPNGIRPLFVIYTENVEVRTYRIINGGGGYYGGGVNPVGGPGNVSHY